MFVRQSTYDKSERQRKINADAYWKLKNEHEYLDDKYKSLLQRWNELVREVNSKGGQQFLDCTSGIKSGSQFTDNELKSLLQLVHPDKHGGKESAKVITQKINSIRSK